MREEGNPDTHRTRDRRESDEWRDEEIREEGERRKCPEVRECDRQCSERRRERHDTRGAKLEEIRDIYRPPFECLTEEYESPYSHE